MGSIEFQIFFLFLAAAAWATFFDWRLGIPLTLLAGVLQDPVRKLMPGAPAYMVVTFAVIWMVVYFRVFGLNNRVWQQFRQANKDLAVAVVFFFLMLCIAAAVVLKHGSFAWKIGALGMFAYTAPLAAMVIGHAYVRERYDLVRLLEFYCLLISVAVVGTLLQYMQTFPDSMVLGTEVLKVDWVRYVGDSDVIDLMSGIFRSPDIMGWHASSAVMLCITLFLYKRGKTRWLWLILACWVSVALVLSGRNKMLYMPVVWAAVVAFISLVAGRWRQPTEITAVLGLVALTFYGAYKVVPIEDTYFVYPLTAQSADRLQLEGVQQLENTFKQTGFFGDGLGIATTGVQRLGISMKSSWQEGGLSKVLVELGVPGLFGAIVFVLVLVMSLFKQVQRMAVLATEPFVLAVGAFAFVVANGMSFVISHQAYADGPVVILLGVMMGVCLSASRWAEAAPDAEARQWLTPTRLLFGWASRPVSVRAGSGRAARTRHAPRSL